MREVSTTGSRSVVVENDPDVIKGPLRKPKVGTERY